jgi:hypothetical protein
VSPAGKRDWRSWPCDSGIASPGGGSVPAQDDWHAAHGMCHPLPCSRTSAQVRHARTADDPAQAGWRGTCRWPWWPGGCEAAGESRALHRRACKAFVREDRRAAGLLQRGTVKGGMLSVGAHTPRAIWYAALVQQTAATRKPLMARVENCVTALTLCATIRDVLN